MKVIARTDEYTVYQKRSGRHAIKGADKRWINGEDKVRILLEHKLIEAPKPKAPEPEEAADAGDEAADAAGEEAAAE